MVNPTFRVGYCDEVITPATPVPMCGYGLFLGRGAESVLDDLYVRAAIIEDFRGAKTCLLSFDLIGFEVEWVDSLKNHISESFGIGPSMVLVACTHTHSGPPTMQLRGMGVVDPVYQKTVEASVMSSIRGALADLRPAAGRWGAKAMEPIGFNRVLGERGALDPQLSVFLLEGEGDPLFIAGHACHPVTLGKNDALSADFPGRFVSEMAKDGARALFLQGFCGNIDPLVNATSWGTGTEADIDAYGKRLAEACLDIAASAEPMGDAAISGRLARISTALDIGVVEQPDRTEARIRETYAGAGKNCLDQFVDSWRREARARVADLRIHPQISNVPVQVLSIGDVHLVAYPGEVFCELGLQIKSRHPRTVPVGCANGVIGYVPTEESYARPGDYACYSAPLFYGVAPFQPSVAGRFLAETELMFGV